MKRIHRHSTGTRDAALRRLTSANRWLIAGSIALTGVLSEVAAQAFPGKRLASTRTSAKRPAAAKHTPPASSEEFHAPESAPQQSESHPPEAPAQQGAGEGAAGESSSPSGESAPRSSESSPQPSESAPPAEAPAQSAPEASAESPPVVSGGS